MVSPSDLNPFGKFDVGLGAIGNVLILCAIAVVIFALIGWLIYWRVTTKAYCFKIPLYKSINGINLRQATYVAKNVPISKSGDSLWYVKGLKKFIAPATMVSAQNEFPHEEREDGEWINFSITTVNEKQKQVGVKFIQQNMRTQRVATGQILEQRLINKGFWEKYQDIIVHLLFYMIVCILMVVIFWQWSNIVDKVTILVDKLEVTQQTCASSGNSGIVPVLIPLMFWWRRKKNEFCN